MWIEGDRSEPSGVTRHGPPARPARVLDPPELRPALARVEVRTTAPDCTLHRCARVGDRDAVRHRAGLALA